MVVPHTTTTCLNYCIALSKPVCLGTPRLVKKAHYLVVSDAFSSIRLGQNRFKAVMCSVMCLTGHCHAFVWCAGKHEIVAFKCGVNQAIRESGYRRGMVSVV